MDTDVYKTKNLNLAAYLYASGLQLTGTTKKDTEVFFNFSPINKAKKLVNMYYRGEANINPQTLFARLNDLRDLIFGGQV